MVLIPPAGTGCRSCAWAAGQSEGSGKGAAPPASLEPALMMGAVLRPLLGHHHEGKACGGGCEVRGDLASGLVRAVTCSL